MFWISFCQALPTSPHHPFSAGTRCEETVEKQTPLVVFTLPVPQRFDQEIYIFKYVQTGKLDYSDIHSLCSPQLLAQEGAVQSS